ncbi:MAG TPA: DUF2071 domain-containing protein [Candidatus Limnocylindrales bacterium]|nr:DUF2071 domain-containing protein [Candidatus Limnocylindrales bacterium]
MHPLLEQTGHRTAPLPSAPWIMVQRWHDLLFAHWALPPEQVRPLVPPELDLDVRQGKAWVGVVPFWMSGIRGRGMPRLPGLSTFPELNVRTYVTCRGVPGVYFWSLDAASRLAVWGARTFYALPYFPAEMSIQSAGQEFRYSCRRLEGPLPADFRGRYRPLAVPRVREKYSLESFLTDRYCLYTVQQGKVYRAYIHHLPWPLQDAEAEIDVNTMAQAAGISLPASGPLLHFSRELEVLIWWPEWA